MFCFDFSASSDLATVPLCEETVRFNPVREDGVSLAATVVVTPNDAKDLVLRVIHPRTFAEAGLSCLRAWQADEAEDGFPYTHVFSNIRASRFVMQGEHEGLFRPFTRQAKDVLAPENQALRVKILDAGMIPVGHLGLGDPDAPFTSFDIGPFPNGGSSYIFRIVCHILPGAAFMEHLRLAGKLIPGLPGGIACSIYSAPISKWRRL